MADKQKGPRGFVSGLNPATIRQGMETLGLDPWGGHLRAPVSKASPPSYPSHKGADDWKGGIVTPAPLPCGCKRFCKGHDISPKARDPMDEYGT